MWTTTRAERCGAGSNEPERITLSGFQGLTLNVTMDLRFRLPDRWALEASFGAPVIAR
ncbi:MAG: hypothetical protein IPG92_13970 [Flavobacteriales bacterium]|nr:hypothetical protein [Flavobacteriales bacterium]